MKTITLKVRIYKDEYEEECIEVSMNKNTIIFVKDSLKFNLLKEIIALLLADQNIPLIQAYNTCACNRQYIVRELVYRLNKAIDKCKCKTLL